MQTPCCVRFSCMFTPSMWQVVSLSKRSVWWTKAHSHIDQSKVCVLKAWVTQVGLYECIVFVALQYFWLNWSWSNLKRFTFTSINLLSLKSFQQPTQHFPCIFFPLFSLKGTLLNSKTVICVVLVWEEGGRLFLQSESSTFLQSRTGNLIAMSSHWIIDISSDISSKCMH